MRYVQAATGKPWVCHGHGGSYVLEKNEGEPFKWLYADGFKAESMFAGTFAAKIADGICIKYTKPFPEPQVEKEEKPTAVLPPLELNIKAKGKTPAEEYVPIGITYRGTHNNNMVGLLCRINPGEAQFFVMSNGPYKGHLLSGHVFIIENNKVKKNNIEKVLGKSWVKE